MGFEGRKMVTRVERYSLPLSCPIVIGRACPLKMMRAPDVCIRPSMMISNVPARGLVYITRIVGGIDIHRDGRRVSEGQEHLSAPVGVVDAYDLREVCDTIMFRGGFCTLSNISAIEVEGLYTGAPFGDKKDGTSISFHLSVIGMAVVVTESQSKQ
jgi:hypothetical protein